MFHWKNQAEFITKVVDPSGPAQWIVELGMGPQIVASTPGDSEPGLARLAPGDYVRIKFRVGRKTPRITGDSSVDRDGQPTPHCH